MHTFFHGWRRKIGVATLVMALAVFGMWMRSSLHQDDFFVSIGDDRIAIASAGGSVSLILAPETDFLKLPLWQSYPITKANGNGYHATNVFGDPYFIPYWIIVLPPTLLSAYLILWEPRE